MAARPGLHRHAVLRERQSGIPGAMITASHNPPKYNGIKLCRAGAKPVGIDTGLTELRDIVASGVPAQRQAAGHHQATGPAPRLRRAPKEAGRPVRASGRSRSPWTPATGWRATPCRRYSRACRSKLIPLYFELDGTFPNHEANPIDPENLRDLQRAVVSTTPTSALPSTATPTAASSWTSGARSSHPSVLTALIAARELAREPGATIIHNLITSRAVPEIITEHGGIAGAHQGRPLVHQGRDGPAPSAIFGGEHSGHFYFRDFWFADSGMLAALHVLAALGEQDGPLSAAARRVLQVPRQRRDQHRGRRPGRDDRDGQAGRSRDAPASDSTSLDGLTVSAPRLVVQPAAFEHRAAAPA